MSARDGAGAGTDAGCLRVGDPVDQSGAHLIRLDVLAWQPYVRVHMYTHVYLDRQQMRALLRSTNVPLTEHTRVARVLQGWSRTTTTRLTPSSRTWTTTTTMSRTPTPSARPSCTLPSPLLLLSDSDTDG